MKTGSNAAPIAGLSHVAIKVSDMDRSLRFYQEFLGFEEQCRLHDPGTGRLKLVCLKINEDQMIEIFPGLLPGENRLHQIAFRVENAEATRDYLEDKGLGRPKVSRGQMGNAAFFVKDPNGYSLEFTQYMPDGWTRRDHGKFLPATRISSRLSHVGVVPSDLKESVRFYQELFGFQETWRGSRDEKTLNWIHLGIPDSKDYVELMLVPTSTPHFCLEVADLEEIKTKLDRNPYRKHYDKAIVYDVGLNRRRLTNLLDPDGIRVEIMEAETIDGVPSPSSPAAIPDHHLK